MTGIEVFHTRPELHFRLNLYGGPVTSLTNTCRTRSIVYFCNFAFAPTSQRAWKKVGESGASCLMGQLSQQRYSMDP
ncbi:hypothetical protein V9T40_005930 [Parthenolecanium corni]|uniref:Uncharacterized protein n=1 Tax=Parthenolecanium corni TaxID=536013 RepID=A0AAN9YAX5_9HEMI